jgi:hypothetical protein
MDNAWDDLFWPRTRPLLIRLLGGLALIGTLVWAMKRRQKA